MPDQPLYRLLLAKESFKFSAAHFTLFGDGRAELLHGHNYHVEVEVAGSELDAYGLLLDIESFKRTLRALCDRLDTKTLIPAESTELRVEQEGDEVEVRLGPRRYRLPAPDTLLLPLANTSIELLARLLWLELVPALAGTRVETMAVSVEESAGQRCWYESAVSR
ncbi:MAG TPA: 6-carboxytetrahydropterin synthase [Thermoanaerobaculia bacterium]